MDPTVINSITHELETAQNNLHGDQKLTMHNKMLLMQLTNSS